MKCPACGYISLERPEACPRCGASAAGDDGAAPFLEVGEQELAGMSPRPSGRAGAGGGEGFLVDDDLAALPDPTPPTRPREEEDTGGLASPEWGEPAPVVERDEQVPERFWAPQAAGLARRLAALAVDLAVLAALLGLFYAGAQAALALGGFDMRLVASPQGRRAALAPFGLLALLLSLAYFVSFHAAAGRTPGKRLLGLQVLRRDGSPPPPATALLRWIAALAGASCAGVGVLWALFEPRRRGWADLCSGTVVAERREGRAGDPGGVDITGSGGYHATAEDGPR